MTSDLSVEVLARFDGEHLCLIYDDEPQEQLPALLPFLRAGLEAGAQCVYVADGLDAGELRAAMRDAGIDVVEAIALPFSGGTSSHAVAEFNPVVSSDANAAGQHV